MKAVEEVDDSSNINSIHIEIINPIPVGGSKAGRHGVQRASWDRL
jgi:hypothetical protein